jgi:hypothetical protein
MLLDSEIARCKAELGYNLLTEAAVPWIGVTIVFEQLIQPYLGGGASTTSATDVTAASTPTPVTLTLASGTGFTSGDRVVIDVDDRQEVVTARLVSGAALTADLSLTHSGTYPVTVEGGESIVRETLRRIRDVKGRMAASFGQGALKKVDEVEFHAASSNLFGNLGPELSYWREELAAALGIQSLWSQRRAGAQRMSVY